MTDSARNSITNEKPLASWKEIAAYVQRDVRTAKRWEMLEGLPVHRHQHLSRSSVYAYPSELESWRAGRRPEPEMLPWWRRPLSSAAFALVLLLTLVTAGGGGRLGEVAAADGTAVRQVWGGEYQAEGAVSPDGRHLAFIDETWNLAVRTLTTGETRRLTNDAGGTHFVASFVFSPDGKHIAFGWYSQPGEFECDLQVVETEGSEVRVLYHAAKHETWPTDWSQDGKFILALREGPEPQNAIDAVSVAASDGSVTILKSFGKGPKPDPSRLRFSPDGHLVAYDFTAGEEGNRDIFALSVATGQVTPLVQHPAQEQLLGWTPDGKSLLFLSDRTGNWAAWLLPVVDGRPQGEPTLVKRDTGAMVPLGFTRDGSFYYKNRIDGLNIYTSTLDGGEPSLLAEKYLGWNLNPSWSPDGKKIAYLSRRQPGSSDATLCIRSVETGQERVYSDKFKSVSKWTLQWSPDGGSFLVRGQDVRGDSGLFTIDVETNEVTQVPWWPPRQYGSYSVGPCWSADGTAVYYVEPSMATSEGRTRLVRTDLATGRHQVIHVFPESIQSGAVSLSPDGRWFLFWMIRGAGWSPAVMPVGGTVIRELPGKWADASAVSLIWAPDSSQILFLRRSETSAKQINSELWSVPVESGEQHSLGYSIKRDVRSLSVHPDGRQLAFTAWEPATEFWVMENFLPPTGAAR